MRLEAVGKNVEIAIQNGLLECGMKRDEVEVKVIEEGGLFKKAKVQLIWGENETKEEVETSDETESETIEETESNSEEETEDVQEEKVEHKRIYDTTRLEAKGVEFLTGLVHFIDPDATVESKAGENEISFVINGEKLGKLIGHHGENMKELQMLLSGLKRRNEGGIRMYLDINGYKENRNQTLVDLANKTAEQAIKIERNIHLDPMNAYDRRIIHTTLQDRTDVTTESTGEGEKRHVVVKPTFRR